MRVRVVRLLSGNRTTPETIEIPDRVVEASLAKLRREGRRAIGRAVLGPVVVMLLCLAALAAVSLGMSSEALGQREKTPIAWDFAGEVVDDESVLFVVRAALPSGGEGLHIGFAVRCEKASRKLEGFMAFGSVPFGKQAQTVVRMSDGRVERFGPVVRGGGPAAGFFNPKVVERADVLRMIDAVFTTGALVSNGHNSVWNRIGEDANRKARTALRRCAGAVE